VDQFGYILATAAIVYLVNCMPALGPPTWAVLVGAELSWGIPEIALIPVGALAATAGRLTLATGFRRWGRKLLPAKRLEGIEAVGEAISQSRKGTVATLAFFMFSPLPSAQLFEAAALTKVPLKPIGLAFLLGRMVSYTIYVTLALGARATIDVVIAGGWHSPQALLISALSVMFLIAFVMIDWLKVLSWMQARWGHAQEPE